MLPYRLLQKLGRTTRSLNPAINFPIPRSDIAFYAGLYGQFPALFRLKKTRARVCGLVNRNRNLATCLGQPTKTVLGN